MIKKIFVCLLLVFSVVGLSGCSIVDRDGLFDYTQMDYEQKVTIGEEVELVKDGVLTVGTSPDYAPYSFLDLELNGLSRIQGSESAIALFIAQHLGLTLEFKPVAFDGLFNELNNDKIDIILAGLTYSDERAKSYTFTDSYYSSGDGGQILLTTKANLEKYNSFDSINQSEVKIAGQNASLQYDLLVSQIPNCSPEKFGSIADGAQMLKNGNVHFLASSRTSAEEIMKISSDFVIVEFFEFDVPEMGTMGLLKKGSPLAMYVNEAISYLPDGTYAEWLTLYQEYSDAIGIDYSPTMIGRVIQIVGRFGLYFLEGTGITLALSIVTVVFGTLIGMLALFIRKSSIGLLKGIGVIYVEVVRGVPLLLQLWVIYLIAPTTWHPFFSVCLALIINSGAYVSEIIRAGIEAIDKGQYEACRSLGLSKFQAMKKVVLPQAVKKISPALGNEFVMLIKETSLASVFFVGDLMTIKNTVTSITFLSLEPFIVIAIIYFVLTFTTSKVIKYFESKLEA